VTAGDAPAAIGEHSQATDVARLSSYDVLREDDIDLERHFAPGAARALDAYFKGAALHITLDPDPQSAAQTHEAIIRLIGPPGDQSGPREDDR
jgi:DNA-binding transcriptional regulator YbjK